MSVSSQLEAPVIIRSAIRATTRVASSTTPATASRSIHSVSIDTEFSRRSGFLPANPAAASCLGLAELPAERTASLRSDAEPVDQASIGVLDLHAELVQLVDEAGQPGGGTSNCFLESPIRLGSRLPRSRR